MRSVSADIGVGEKKTSITYSECVIIAFGKKYAMRMRRIVVCDLFLSTTIFRITPLTARLSQENYGTLNVL